MQFGINTVKGRKKLQKRSLERHHNTSSTLIFAGTAIFFFGHGNWKGASGAYSDRFQNSDPVECLIWANSRGRNKPFSAAVSQNISKIEWMVNILNFKLPCIYPAFKFAHTLERFHSFKGDFYTCILTWKPIIVFFPNIPFFSLWTLDATPFLARGCEWEIEIVPWKSTAPNTSPLD